MWEGKNGWLPKGRDGWMNRMKKVSRRDAKAKRTDEKILG